MNCISRSYYRAIPEKLFPKNLTGQIVWPEFIRQNNEFVSKTYDLSDDVPLPPRTESMPLTMTYMWGFGLCPLLPQIASDCHSLLYLCSYYPGGTHPWRGVTLSHGRGSDEIRGRESIGRSLASTSFCFLTTDGCSQLRPAPDNKYHLLLCLPNHSTLCPSIGFRLWAFFLDSFTVWLCLAWNLLWKPGWDLRLHKMKTASWTRVLITLCFFFLKTIYSTNLFLFCMYTWV